MQTLYENDTIRVLYDPRGADISIVSFAHMRFSASETNSYWGQSAFEKAGFSAVGVICKTDTWYPAREVIPAIGALAACLPDANRIAYGFSMGGYGALRFGKAFGADIVFAVSPQISIDPRFWSGRDSRFSSYFDEELHENMRIEQDHLPDNVYAFYDPYHIYDRINVEALQTVRHVTGVTLHHMGHDTAEVFASSAMFRELCLLAVEDDQHGVAKLAKTTARASYRRKAGLAACAHLKKRPAMGDAIISKYFSDGGDWWPELYRRAIAEIG